MRIAVLGANGQVGQAIASECRRSGGKLLPFSHLQIDITSRQSLMNGLAGLSNVVVINAASYTAVDAAEKDPRSAFRINCYGAGNVASVCQKFRLPLIHLSTDYVFGGNKDRPYVETDNVGPLNQYGLSKEAGEQAVRWNHDRHVILRTGWLFGPYGKNFLKTMLNLSLTKDEWDVVEDQVGTPTSTTDLAEAILIVAKRISEKHDYCGLYHFGGAEAVTWFDFACEIVEAQASLTGRRPSVRPIKTMNFPSEALRPANSRLSSDLFSDHFNMRAASLASRIREACSSCATIGGRRPVPLVW